MSNERVRGKKLIKSWAAGVRAIDEVDVEVAPGAITAIVGANGAGKSTLLGILAGALAPSSGEVELCGLKQPFSQPRALRRLQARLSYVTQDPALDPEMTGAETLSLMSALYRVAEGDLAERFGIAEILPRPIATWSGGQKRRLHLACALLHSPEVIFLDEPTAGLDGQGARLLFTELDRRAQAGATVLLVGHDLEEIEREATSVIILDRGKIIAAGTPAALAAEHARTWLRVTLQKPPEDPAALVRTVEALPGFSRATIEGRRLWVQAEEPDLAPLLAAIPSPVADVAIHRRDLASVYRTLTGRELESQPRQKMRGGARA